MNKPIEQPVTVAGKDHHNDSVTTHPAFAQISACRVSGRTNLYEIVEVYLSEAQWATFVSAMNIGDSTPCTINSLHGKSVPGLPDPKLESEQHSAEVREKLESTLLLLEELRTKINASGLSQKKAAELHDAIHQVHMTFGVNLDFACESFDKHVEKTVEKAKQEVHGYITGNIMRAGLEALGSPIEMPMLESPK